MRAIAKQLTADEMPRLWEDGRQATIVQKLRELGYLYVTVDLAGFQSGSANLLLGNFLFTYLNAAGAMRRGYYDLVRYALFSPLYWALMSVGAWKGAAQLVTRPSYWEKTVHGLTGGR